MSARARGDPSHSMQVTRIEPDWPAPSLMHRRGVVRDRITYVGLDVHKDAVVVAIAEGGLRGEVREYGRIANTATALDRLIRCKPCFRIGSPPPQIVIDGSTKSWSSRGTLDGLFRSGQAAHAIGRKTMPLGTSPVLTKLHNATSSFLAGATIMVLRMPPPGGFEVMS